MIGIAIRLKSAKCPNAAEDIAIGQKAKRGRKPKATKALLY